MIINERCLRDEVNAVFRLYNDGNWTFYCYKCRGMASMKTCPHGKDDRLMLSGTMLRKTLSEGGDPPEDFSRPEVVAVLKDYYSKLDEKVEVKLHRAATGN